MIKAVPKSASGNTDDSINPTITTGTLSIDFCNFFGATMHYDIYDSYYSESPISSGDITKDTELVLAPGTYYITGSLKDAPSGIKLWTTNEDDSRIESNTRQSVLVEGGKTTLVCYLIMDNPNSRNARVVFNPTFGKEILGENNQYGDNVSIIYTIQHGTEYMEKMDGYIYDDTVVNFDEYDTPAKYSFKVKAISASETDVSDKYVLRCSRLFDNNMIHGQTDTICICIYRGCKINFQVPVNLESNQQLYIDCKQLGMDMPGNDGVTLAYDIPFDVKCMIKTTDRDNDTWETYCEYENMKIFEGDSTVIILERNIN